MIRVFKGTDTDFTSNGDKVIQPIDAVITKTDEEEYITVEAPLKYAEFLIQDNILIADTLTGKKGYRIHNPTVGKTVTIKALLHYQENQPLPADRGAVISYGKNLEDCGVAENWDNVVTKLTPIGYNEAALPEGYLSVVSPHQREYEKTIEFELSESIEADIAARETAIEEGAAIVKNLETTTAALEAKIVACDAAITNLQSDIVTIQAKIDALGTSETELKEKDVLEAQITSINDQISSLSADNIIYGNTLIQLGNDLVSDREALTTAQSSYTAVIVNDLRTQAQSYLDANIYPQVNYKLEAHLDGIIEVGDTVKVKHERMKIDMLAYVTAYQYDCMTSKFTNVQFGTKPVSLKSKITGMEQNIRVVSDGVKTASTLIEQLSEQIVLRVDTVTGKIALFKLGSTLNGTDILIKADNINLEGLVTANQFFQILQDGSTKQVNGDFSGKITGSSFIGGSIESENYVPNVSGSKMYLTDGAIDTKNFKITADGKVIIKDMAVDIETDDQEKSVMVFNYGTMQMTLTPSSVKFTNTTTGKSVTINNFTSSPRISFTEDGTTVVQMSTDGISMDNKPIFASSITEGGVLLSDKYAPKNHTHSGYATTADLDALATWASNSFQPKA